MNFEQQPTTSSNDKIEEPETEQTERKNDLPETLLAKIDSLTTEEEKALVKDEGGVTLSIFPELKEVADLIKPDRLEYLGASYYLDGNHKKTGDLLTFVYNIIRVSHEGHAFDDKNLPKIEALRKHYGALSDINTEVHKMTYPDLYAPTNKSSNKQVFNERPTQQPQIGSAGTWNTSAGMISGEIVTGQIDGPFVIKTKQGKVQVDKIF